MECPKCKYEPTLAEHTASPEICPKCGVVYAKAQARQEAAAQPVTGKVAAGIAGAKAGVAASRQQREEREWQAKLSASAPDCVVVTGVQIPFLSLIWLMTKIILAALPALILAGFIVLAITSVVGGAISGYSSYTERAERAEGFTSSQAPAAAPAVSEDEAPPAAASRSREDVMETCKSIASFAETAIESHHRGMPLSSVLELTDSQLLSDIVMDAYSKPRYSTAEVQDRARAEFRDKYYLECMRASR